MGTSAAQGPGASQWSKSDIVKLMQEILDDKTYGSTEGGKLTSCSLRNISKALAEKDVPIEKSIVQRIIKDLGYVPLC